MSHPALHLRVAVSWGPAAAIRLSLDAPSPQTGTGAALYLDGEDAAAVRATVVDAQGEGGPGPGGRGGGTTLDPRPHPHLRAGHVVRDSSLSVTFAVLSGPGLVWATGNGDPANQASRGGAQGKQASASHPAPPPIAGAQRRALAPGLPRPCTRHRARGGRRGAHAGRGRAPCDAQPRGRPRAAIRQHRAPAAAAAPSAAAGDSAGAATGNDLHPHVCRPSGQRHGRRRSLGRCGLYGGVGMIALAAQAYFRDRAELK